MATSTMAIDIAGKITTFTNQTDNTPTTVNSTISEIVTKFNAMLETTSGHSHDGTDSRSLASGVAGLTVQELSVARIMGWQL